MEISFGGMAHDLQIVPRTKEERNFVKICEKQIAKGGRIKFIVEDAEDKQVAAYYTRTDMPKATRA